MKWAPLWLIFSLVFFVGLWRLSTQGPDRAPEIARSPPIVEVQKPAVKQAELDLRLYLDDSKSMLGYKTSQEFKSLMSRVAPGFFTEQWSLALTVYPFSGGALVENSLKEYHAGLTQRYFQQYYSNISGVFQAIIEQSQGGVSLVVTDNLQQVPPAKDIQSDCYNNDLGCWSRALSSLVLQGRSITLFALRLPFKGKYYTVENNQQNSIVLPRGSTRPLYFWLVQGNQVMDRDKNILRLYQSLNAYFNSDNSFLSLRIDPVQIEKLKIKPEVPEEIFTEFGYFESSQIAERQIFRCVNQSQSRNISVQLERQPLLKPNETALLALKATHVELAPLSMPILDNRVEIPINCRVKNSLDLNVLASHFDQASYAHMQKELENWSVPNDQGADLTKTVLLQELLEKLRNQLMSEPSLQINSMQVLSIEPREF